MTFNLWFDGRCEVANVDVGYLLRWLGELKFEEDVSVDVLIREVAKECTE